VKTTSVAFKVALGCLGSILGLLFLMASGWCHGGRGQTPVVTKAEFDQVREGMSYEEVAQIIGASGEVLSSSDLGGTKTIMYSWQNGNGSNMNAMFQGDRLVNKAQFGLR
jgi:uncharacterized protein DUF3862